VASLCSSSVGGCGRSGLSAGLAGAGRPPRRWVVPGSRSGGAMAGSGGYTVEALRFVRDKGSSWALRVKTLSIRTCDSGALAS
jgi:hypothetical protein